jgi:hypothetical protein
MPTPNWDSLAEIIDNIDTQWAVRGSLSVENVNDLTNILEQIQPFLAGEGSQLDVNIALEMYMKIHKMMGREIGQSSEDVDETPDTGEMYATCPWCGEEVTGTEMGEVKQGMIAHYKAKHPKEYAELKAR